MVFIVQDKQEDPLTYIGSLTVLAAAEDLVRALEDQDREDGCYEPGRYIVRKAGLCYSDESKTCGYAHNCICMLEKPDIDCPKAKRRAVQLAENPQTPVW